MRFKIHALWTILGWHVVTGSSFAQCTNPAWLPGEGVAGTNLYTGASALWDPDGTGPLGIRVVIGGRFDVAGTAQAGNIAAWDPATNEWFDLAGGLSPGSNGQVHAIAVLPNGHIVAGGTFSDGASGAENIAEFDGTSWHSLGAGLPSVDYGVQALTVMPNGDLVAGGSFTVPGGSTVANNIARWNGTAWIALGDGLTDANGENPIAALAVLPNGNLIAGGAFTTSGTTPLSKIARWDGSAWHAMGTGMNVSVRALAVAPNGNLISAGVHTVAGGIPSQRIALWNSTLTTSGTAWSALPGIDPEGSRICHAVIVLPDGSVVAGGSIRTVNGGTLINGVARWNGSAWAPMGTGVQYSGGVDGRAIFTLLRLPDGSIVAGGQFSTAGNAAAANLTRWNGTAWNAVSAGFNDWLDAVVEAQNGDVLAGGAFTTAGVHASSPIARWNGSTWTPIGAAGDLQGGAFVAEILELPDGTILAGGGFYFAGQDPFADPIHALASWDGSEWSSLAVDNAYVYALARLPNGDLVAGGIMNDAGGVPVTNVARWNGTTWSSMGDGLGTTTQNDSVQDLLVTPSGELYAAGLFASSGATTLNNVARWNGTAWLPLDTGTDGVVTALARASNGDIYAAGLFSSAGSSSASKVARWNGTAWSALGSGVSDGGVYAAVVAANNDLYVAGDFTDVSGAPASGIARWNGSTWSALGSGIDGGTSGFFSGYTLATRANGDLVVGGQFNRAGGRTSVNFAIVGCRCPADLDDGTGTGTQDEGVDINDLIYFLTQFELGSVSVDLDDGTSTGTPDGGVDINDLLYFLIHFEAGC